MTRRPAWSAALNRRPDLPLVVVFAWYPLWWLLGLTQLVVLVTTALMAGWLLRQRTWILPRGLGWWALFMIWTAAGVFVVKVQVPGAIDAADNTRYLTWALRVVWLLETAVILLYVRNVRERLSGQRISRIFATMFVTIVVGGVLGSLVPALQLHSVMDYLVPGRFGTSPFVTSLVHPNLAERQGSLTDIRYRPSAPFPYANAWGLNFACFLPFFVRAWLGRDAGWRRFGAPLVLAAAAIPVIYSLNRGLWAILLLLLVVVAVKQTASGHYRPLLLMAGAVVVAVTMVALTPLSHVFESRFSGHNSNQGRSSLASITIKGMTESSPVIGDGTTRNTQGSFYSIAGGATPDCYTCSPPALGTQGFLWWMLFATGFVGAFLGLVFFLGSLWRHRSGHDPTRIACWCSLLAFVVALPIYDYTITAGLVVMAAIGVLDRSTPGRSPVVAVPPRLGSLSVNPRRWIVCLAIGLTLGAAWQWHHGTTYVARATVYLPDDPTQFGRQTTLDSEARYMSGPNVLGAAAVMRAEDEAQGRGVLRVDATANSRLLNITYTSTSSARAQTVAELTAQAFVEVQQSHQAAAHDENRDALERQLSDALLAQRKISGTLRRLPASELTGLIATNLGGRLAALRTASTSIAHQIHDISYADREQPRVDGHAVVSVTAQRWNVSLLSGLLLGLLGAAGLERLSRRRGPAIGVADGRQRRVLGLDLSILDGTAPDGTTYLSADPADDTLCAITRKVAGRDPSMPHHGGVMLVATPTTRVTQVVRRCADLQSRGLKVTGVLVEHEAREEALT